MPDGWLRARVARLDRPEKIGEAIVLMADREQVVVRTVNERFAVEPVERARLKGHGGDGPVVVDHDSVDRGIEMDEIIVDGLVVAVADPAIDAQRHGAYPRRHPLQIGHDGVGTADAADPAGRESLRLRGRKAAAHPARVGRILPDSAYSAFEIEMTFLARDAIERIALEHDVTHVGHHDLIIAGQPYPQIIEVDGVAPRVNRAGERTGLEHPDHVNAVALEIARDPQAGPADQQQHITLIIGAERFDEDSHLLDAEPDGGAEHQAPAVGTWRW